MNERGVQFISRKAIRRVPNEKDDIVLVSVPSRNCNHTIFRAVQSILLQSHRRLMVVVTSDGDGRGPFEALRSIDDDRLVTLELPESHGPLVAHDIALRAAESFPYFAVQDADDESTPDRLAVLLRAIRRRGVDAAFSEVMDIEPDGTHRFSQCRPWTAEGMPLLAEHFGVYRRQKVLELGGYYGGVRVGYDQFVTSLMAAFGRCVVIKRPLYTRHVRADSLTRAPSTGWGSPLRETARVTLLARYQHLLGHPEEIPRLRDRHVSVEERRMIDTCAASLRERLVTARRKLGWATPEQTRGAQRTKPTLAVVDSNGRRDLDPRQSPDS